MITKKMLKSFESAIKRWKDENEDPEMLNVYSEDRLALTNILEALRENNNKKAWELIENLDTIVRDQVPEAIYDILFDEFDKDA